jgi:cation:H+ antiporter
MIAIIIMILGFALLIKGADFLVDGSSALALRLNVPQIVIGLTIVAFGTSTPELIVNIFSSVNGQNDIAFGNVIGSNIMNLFLILGIAALIYPLKVKRNTVKKEIPFSLICSVVLFILVNDTFIDSQNNNILSHIDALILIIMFVIFLYYNFTLIKNNNEEIQDYKNHSWLKIVLLIISGLFGLILGGKLVVDNAVIIAQYFNISKKIIGLTIVAAGTSLPELVTSVVAAFKKHSDIAIGNVIGSNIFNITLILGVSGLIKPIDYKASFNLDNYILIAGTFILYVFMFLFKKHKLDRIEGSIFLLTYIAYILYLILFT